MSLRETIAKLTAVWWMSTWGTCPMLTEEDYPVAFELVMRALREADK